MQILKKGGKLFALGRRPARIVDLLLTHGQLSYDELRKRTRIPQGSLYVYCSLLDKAGIVGRKKIDGLINVQIRGRVSFQDVPGI